MLAFLLVGLVLCVVAGRVSWVSKYRSVEQPELVSSTPGKLPEYAILDRSGRTIAHSVPRFDLELSPRAMWQMHTPERIAGALHGALEGSVSQEQLLASFFPSASQGVIQAKGFRLNARQANRVGQWLAGEASEEPKPALEGMWLQEVKPGREWTIHWRPLEVLSLATRNLHHGGSAMAWGRSLANGLAKCMLQPGEEMPRSNKPATELRESIWKRLIPRATARVLEGIPSERVMALRRALKDQNVAPRHMQISFERDRKYPAENQELFGTWGYVTEADTEPRPRGGLELMCDRLVRSEAWQPLVAPSHSSYLFRRDKTVLGQRVNTYLGYEEASAAPYVESTLDLHLQGYLTSQLKEIKRAHRPAMALGIVVDINSGDVLAVDSVETYGVQPFAPIFHTFTIGSTFKIMTMASALEEGLVTPDERIEVGDGAYPIRYTRGPRAGRMSGRVIREAEGARKGTIEVRDAFAFSVNAGMAQVGLRLEDQVFRGYLEKLGYGNIPGSGLGIERAGLLPGLPWSYAYTHASICFGHEITSTLWQHASAVTSVLRGGTPVRLRMVQALGRGSARYTLAPEELEPIYSERTSAKILEMMRHGADVGTGRHVRKQMHAFALAALPANQREGITGAELIDLGTKTGTAQKVSSELCVHVEKEERKRLAQRNQKMTMAHYKTLIRLPKDHRECYTSSIVIYAKLAGSERELMVYIVVEEPRGSERFGSRVAGPAAARVMAEALGLTADGKAPRNAVTDGVYASCLTAQNSSEEPWCLDEANRW